MLIGTIIEKWLTEVNLISGPVAQSCSRRLLFVPYDVERQIISRKNDISGGGSDNEPLDQALTTG